MQSSLLRRLGKKQIEDRKKLLFFHKSPLFTKSISTMRITPMVSPTLLTFSAITNLSTITYTNYLHVTAFSPSVSRREMIGQRMHVMNLSSSTAPMKLEDEQSLNKSSLDSETKTRVVATALPKSFISSPNGLSGVMAVKLREEDYSAPIISDPVADAPKIDGMSQSGMFGGVASQSNSKNKKSTEVEDLTGKAVQFSNGRMGTIIAQRPPMAFVLCDFAEWDESKISKEDDQENNEIISILSERTSVKVGDHLIGQVVDCYGQNVDIIPAEDVVERAIFAPIPQIKDIALINSPLLTGTAMVDALAPIGKGQNMLVIGQDTGVGQRDLMIAAIKTQLTNNVTNKEKRVKCVYSITTPDTKVRQEVMQKLKDEGLLNDIVVVTSRDHGVTEDDNIIASAEAITVAATACSIAQAFALSRGDDTFVVVDDLDNHKSFWDWTTRVLVDIYGVDAVVKDDINGGASSEMRGFYSSLIQRAARYNMKNGGGSMTLALITDLAGKFGDDNDDNLTFTSDDFEGSSEKIKQRISILVDKGIPLTPDTLRKIQIPVPVASEAEKKRRLALQHVDDLISMSDGQIWLDETLYTNGQRPAIDPQRSITRVGVGADTPCRADAPAMRGLAGGLRFNFAQAASLEGADKNSGADKQLLKRDAYLLAMHQESGEVRSLSENCVALLASSLGLLDETIKQGGKAGTKLGQERIEELLKHVWQSSPKIMEEIDQTLDISSTARSELETVIKEYLS